MIKLSKYLKKIPSFEIVLQTNNSNSIINDTISSSNTSHDFNLIMDETLTPSLSQASIILDDYTTSDSNGVFFFLLDLFLDLFESKEKLTAYQKI